MQWEGCCNVVFVREALNRFRPRKVKLVDGPGSYYQVTEGLSQGEEIVVDFETVPGQMVYSLIVDGKSYEARINETDGTWAVYLKGTLYDVEVMDERESRLREAGSGDAGNNSTYSLKSPMP